MGILVGYDANTPTQLWIAARYLEALSLLAAPLMFRPAYPDRILCSGLFSCGSVLFFCRFFTGGDFPDCFLPTAGGLTPFKIVSEYIICLLFVIAGMLLFRFRKHFAPNVLKWLLASIGTTNFVRAGIYRLCEVCTARPISSVTF